jgi:hypothetical protein
MIAMVTYGLDGYREIIVVDKAIKFTIVVQIAELILARKPVRYFSGFV